MVRFKAGDLIKSNDCNNPIERKLGIIINKEGIDAYHVLWINYETSYGVGKIMIFGEEYLKLCYQVIEDGEI